MKIMLANFTKMVNDSGGMAKVCCAMANEFQRRGHQVSLVYSDIQEGSFFYPVDKNVKLYDLRHFRGQSIKFPLYLKAKREFLRAFDKERARTVNNDFAEKFLLKNLQTILAELNSDIIVSYQPAASKMLLCDLKISIPVVTMSHGDPEDYFTLYPKKELPSLEKSAMCQVLLPSFAQHLHNHLAHVKTIVIGNVVPQYKAQADLLAPKAIHKILFVGRLAERHKRPHLLIEAFIKLAPRFPNWQLELWGADDGKIYRKKLEQLITQADLQERILLKGTTKDIPSVLPTADIFVIPSAYEGFSLAMTEAMSMGLPVVGYKTAPSVNELIADGVDGFLCNDGVDALTEKLSALMANKELRVKMGQAAREKMTAYAPQKIWNTWENLLQNILKNK